MSGHVNVNGTWKDLKTGYANINGNWIKLKAGYANINGTWTKIYSGLDTINFTMNIVYKLKYYDKVMTTGTLTSWSRDISAYLRNGMETYNTNKFEASVKVNDSDKYELGKYTINTSGTRYICNETNSGRKSAYQGRLDVGSNISSSEIDKAIQATHNITITSDQSFDFTLKGSVFGCGYNSCIFSWGVSMTAKYRYNHNTNTVTFLGHTGGTGSDTIYPVSNNTSLTQAWSTFLSYYSHSGGLIIYPYGTLTNTVSGDDSPSSP